MAELIDVFNAMVRRTNWDKITDEEKDKNFFIFNRYFSKKYPKQAQLLNLKSIDKVVAMEIWYHFIRTQPYPNWFWSKGEKSDKPIIAAKDFRLLLVSLKIKPDDLNYLIENHFDFIKEELSYLKKVNT